MRKEKMNTIKINDNTNIYIQKNGNYWDWKIDGVTSKNNSFVKNGKSTTRKKAFRDAKIVLADKIPIKIFTYYEQTRNN